MAPTTRNCATSKSASIFQAHQKQQKSATKRELPKRKRILEREESAGAARRELEWESGQTCKSGAQALRGEADEILDDPSTDESGEDEDDDLEEAPHNARKRFRAATPTEDDGGNEPEDDNESDTALDTQLDAFLKFSRAKKLKLGTRKINGPSFEVSSPVPLYSKLPKARQSAPHPRITSTHQPSSPSAATAPSTPRRSQYSTSHSRPRMVDQTPITKAVVKTANCIFRVYVSTENAFPTEDEIGARAHASFKRACKDLKQTETLARFETDIAYASIQAKIVSVRPAQIRGELKTKVQRTVAGHYGLHGLPKSKLKLKIATLLCAHAYVFQNPEKREGFFQHPIFSEIFAAQWLRKRGEATGEYAPAFNPVPLQTLALIAAAIECALRDYTEGFKETKRGINDFSGDLYRGTYDGHLSTLRKQDQKHPHLILKLRRDIFQTAFSSTGNLSQVEENHDYLGGDFNLEADMARLRDANSD